VCIGVSILLAEEGAYSRLAKIRLAIGGDHEYIFVDGTVPADPAPGTLKDLQVFA
jgi:hypothetical protein